MVVVSNVVISILHILFVLPLLLLLLLLLLPYSEGTYSVYNCGEGGDLSLFVNVLVEGSVLVVRINFFCYFVPLVVVVVATAAVIRASQLLCSRIVV